MFTVAPSAGIVDRDITTKWHYWGSLKCSLLSHLRGLWIEILLLSDTLLRLYDVFTVAPSAGSVDRDITTK